MRVLDSFYNKSTFTTLLLLFEHDSCDEQPGYATQHESETPDHYRKFRWGHGGFPRCNVSLCLHFDRIDSLPNVD